MDSRSNMHQNILLINTINPPSFGIAMTPLVKSPSDENGFILELNREMEDLSLFSEKKSPLQEINTIYQLNRDNLCVKTITPDYDKPKAITEENAKEQEDNIHVEVHKSLQVVVGIAGTVCIGLKDKKKKPISSDDISIYMVVDNNDTVPCEISDEGDSITMKFLPAKVGPCEFVIKSKANVFNQTRFTIEVYGNNPEISFSESGTDWPVIVAFKPSEKCVYLAFNHHISKFTESGDFMKVILRERNAYINDLAIDPCRSRLAIGVSGWKDSRGYKFRFQEARLYTMTGTLIWAVGQKQPLLFGVPILHLAFTIDGDVIVAGHKCIDVCNRSTGNISQSIKLDQLIIPSRITPTPDGGFAITEASEGTVHVYDKFWNLNIKVPIIDSEGKKVHGVCGLAVDPSGNILVSSCEKEELFVYSSDGKLTSMIESDWDCPKWPLSLSATNDGYLFVADHGNACAKKYKYM